MLTRAVAYQSVMSLGNAVALLAGHRAIVSDTFTRADSATTLGNAETGQAWSALLGTWGISSNAAYIAATGGVAPLAVVDSLAATASVQATFLGAQTIQYLAFRASDASNFLIAGTQSNTTVNLYKSVAGALTSLGSWAHTTVSGDVFKVTFVGSSITLFVNGVALGTAVDSFNATATKHGMYAGSGASTAMQWDNFKVTAP